MLTNLALFRTQISVIKNADISYYFLNV